jgi:hypothetical protein
VRAVETGGRRQPSGNLASLQPLDNTAILERVRLSAVISRFINFASFLMRTTPEIRAFQLE